MGDKSAISWTGSTWDFLAGCTKHSPGCGLPLTAGADRAGGCYAIRTEARLQHLPGHEGLVHRTGGGLDWTGRVNVLPRQLSTPRRWSTPRLVFVCSRSDIGHHAVPDHVRAAAWATMFWASPAAAALPRRSRATHTFQVLSKRPGRMRTWLKTWADFDRRRRLLAEAAEFGMADAVDVEYAEAMPEVLPNIWLGTSIETDTYSGRADEVRRSPAATRFLSLEPLLGPLPSLNLEGIDWVIVGGESGPRYRPLDLDAARDLRDRCVASNIKFYFKQVGGLHPLSGGEELDGRAWKQMPTGAGLPVSTCRGVDEH